MPLRTRPIQTTPEPDLDKIHLYCSESVAHFDWLVAQGVPFNDSMVPGKHVLQMTDECLIWSGNEEAWPYRELAKPAPRGHKVALEGHAGGAKLMEILSDRTVRARKGVVLATGHFTNSRRC